jgi:hypothetical protein
LTRGEKKGLGHRKKFNAQEETSQIVNKEIYRVLLACGRQYERILGREGLDCQIDFKKAMN